MLTDRNKDQFEEYVLSHKNLSRWNFQQRNDCIVFEDMDFYQLPFEMQWGVYLAYADSLDYDIEIIKYWCMEAKFDVYVYNKEGEGQGMFDIEINSPLNTRQEAQRAALKAFDKLINNTITKNEN